MLSRWIWRRWVEGARLIRHQSNLGFLRTCNEAVASAEGDYVLLLNNDTVVHPHAIEALLETFTQFEDVGAACAQLRFPDGTLQEAGVLSGRMAQPGTGGAEKIRSTRALPIPETSITALPLH